MSFLNNNLENKDNLIKGINPINKRNNNDIYSLSDSDEKSINFEGVDKKWPGDCPCEYEINDLINSNKLSMLEVAQMMRFINLIKKDGNYKKLLIQFKKLKEKVYNENYLLKEAKEYGFNMRLKYPEADGPWESNYLLNKK